MDNYDKAFENLISEGYEFRTNFYIKEGFELFKKFMAGFIGFFILYLAFFVGISYLQNQYVNILTNLLQPALTAGVLIVANEVFRGNNPNFGKFFSGFKFFLALTFLNVVSSIIIVVGLIFLIVPGIYLAVSYSFANMFVVFLGYDFWPAMELSRKIISKNWWSVFGFFVLILLINIGGVLACGVGIIFTAPATACMTYIAFEDIVGGAIKKHSTNYNTHADKTENISNQNEL